jgi:hypothetical protein
LNIDGFLQDVHVFFNSAEGAYLEQRAPTSTLKI